MATVPASEGVGALLLWIGRGYSRVGEGDWCRRARVGCCRGPWVVMTIPRAPPAPAQQEEAAQAASVVRAATAETGATGGGGSEQASVVWIGAHPTTSSTLRRGSPISASSSNRAASSWCSPTASEATATSPEDAHPIWRRCAWPSSKLRPRCSARSWCTGNLGDGTAGTPEGVLANWATAAGSEQDLLAQLVAEIAGAEAVVTFDPRHGDSCHADHRAAGALALAAVAEAGIAPGKREHGGVAARDQAGRAR